MFTQDTTLLTHSILLTRIALEPKIDTPLTPFAGAIINIIIIIVIGNTNLNDSLYVYIIIASIISVLMLKYYYTKTANNLSVRP